MTLVRAERITKTFGDVIALRGVDLQLDEGRTLLIVGHNGSGKTTLLNCLATLTRPDSGRLILFPGDTEPHAALLRRYRALIGYAGHKSFLYSALTVQENLRLFSSLSGRELSDGRIAELLDCLKLPKQLLRRSAGGCSEGERRKVSLLRALAKEPKILFLDEPFTGLDRESRELLLSVLDRMIQGGAAVVAASHDPDFISRGWHETISMFGGKVHRPEPRGGK